MFVPEIELTLSSNGKELTIKDLSVLTENGYDYQFNSRVISILNLFDERTVEIDLLDSDNADLLASWIGEDRKIVLTYTHLGFTSPVLPDAVWFVNYVVEAALLSKTTITFSQAAVASNQSSITLMDGLSSTEHNITFSSTSNAFLTDIAAQLVSHSTVESASVVNAGAGTDDDRVIILTPSGDKVIDITEAVVTGGVSQPTLIIGVYPDTAADYTTQATLIGRVNIDCCTNKSTAQIPTSETEEIKDDKIEQIFTAEMYKTGAVAAYNIKEYIRAQKLLNRGYKVCSFVKCC